jgi:hypothetical protein
MLACRVTGLLVLTTLWKDRNQDGERGTDGNSQDSAPAADKSSGRNGLISEVVRAHDQLCRVLPFDHLKCWFAVHRAC